MVSNLKSNIKTCEDVYNTRLGKGNWALTNYGGGTKVLVKNNPGYYWGFSQLDDNTVDSINKHFDNDVDVLLKHSFGGV